MSSISSAAMCVVHSYVMMHGPIFSPSVALGPLMDSDTDSSEDEAEISSPEVKALQDSCCSKVGGGYIDGMWYVISV